MNQQINLYQPIFRKQKKIFSAYTMLQTCLFFIFVFAAITAYEMYHLKPMQEQLAKIDQDLAHLEAQLEKEKAKKQTDAKTRLLKNEIARLTRELEEREKIKRALRDDEIGNSKGFSPYLEALARQHVNGTWLTRIVINNGGAGLGLEGRTLSSDLVPVYIQRLSNEKVMTGASFNVMELQRPEKETAQIAFRVSSN
ncbi:MAG TPA: PilN domain-containing protein [Gammaproteobacteria bacterium]|nr:PilN domain-containing protein [Gammaproteobacteria bacterium]